MDLVLAQHYRFRTATNLMSDSEESRNINCFFYSHWFKWILIEGKTTRAISDMSSMMYNHLIWICIGWCYHIDHIMRWTSSHLESCDDKRVGSQQLFGMQFFSKKGFWDTLIFILGYIKWCVLEFAWPTETYGRIFRYVHF